MLVARPKLFEAQVPRCRAHDQGNVVGRIINPHHIQDGLRKLFIVQRTPASQPDGSRFPKQRSLHVRDHLWMGMPGMQDLAMHRRAARFPTGRGRRTPEFGVDAMESKVSALLPFDSGFPTSAPRTGQVAFTTSSAPTNHSAILARFHDVPPGGTLYRALWLDLVGL